MEVIDCTPTWTGIVRHLAHVFVNGDPAGYEPARTELHKMGGDAAICAAYAYLEAKHVEDMKAGETELLRLAGIVDDRVAINKAKVYYTQDNIGTAKYTVSYHDGETTHGDGSPFFDIKLFNNKKKCDTFIKNLISDHYTERGIKL